MKPDDTPPRASGWRLVFQRARRSPVRLLGRAIQKLIVGRIRYGTADGYDAEAYWRDRFTRHGSSPRGPGHEGLSEAVNADVNWRAAESLCTVLRTSGINLSSCNVLDIGPGAGFATAICARAGVRRYTALDITDALFPELEVAYPEYRFSKGDISVTELAEQFDLVLLLEVLEHIVNRERLATALQNVVHALAPGGTMVLAFDPKRGSPRRFFYLRFWDIGDIAACLPGFAITVAGPWRFGKLITCRRDRPIVGS